MSVLANIDALLWDSAFFNRSIAKLTDIHQSASPSLTDDALNSYQLVQAKIAANDYLSLIQLQEFGFQIVDGEIDLEITVNNCEIVHSACLPIATETDIAPLRTLAENSFSLSRFRAPWFSERDNQRFYAEWAEKAVLGTFDDLCLIMRDDTVDAIKGFVTLKRLNDAEMRVGLLAVNPDYRKSGVGEALIAAAKNRVKQDGLSCLRVATQTGNVAALRLYIKCGATIASASYWLYRSMNNDKVIL
jgi:dTDP-4-amino-4,6-dideoxy-D-galactose acyltransferase